MLMKKNGKGRRRIILSLFCQCCLTFPLFALPCSCAKIDDFENFEDIPNPYANKSASEFIAVFGDIQYYTNYSNIKLFKRSLDWIEYVAKDLKILCALHTGDVTNSCNSAQWSHFGNAIKGFSKSIPFITNIGDHDYYWDGAYINSRNDTSFSEHTEFPLVRNMIETAFEEGRMENIVVRNEIHGQRYDFLLLEFGPRKEVVEWAKEWVTSHPDIKYILMNHEYLESGGGRRVSNLKCKLRLRNTTYVTPDELWNELVKHNDNIVCILCGHVGSLYAVTYEKNDFGRDVCQIQHNIQGSGYRYDNWLMVWEFPEDGDDAIISIVNTRTGLLFDSKESLFTFKYRY